LTVTLDRTLIAGGLGLVAIVVALGAKANSVPIASNSGFRYVSVTSDGSCPNDKAMKAIVGRPEKPVGSLSLVL
jgi:hypothetical protein